MRAAAPRPARHRPLLSFAPSPRSPYSTPLHPLDLITARCALPEYIEQHFNCFSIRLRAATHLVVGLTANQSDIVKDQVRSN